MSVLGLQTLYEAAVIQQEETI